MILINQVICSQQEIHCRQSNTASGLQVDQKLKFHWSFNWQIGWSCAVQNLFHIIRDTLGLKDFARSIGQQGPTGHEFAPRRDQGKPLIQPASDRTIVGAIIWITRWVSPLPCPKLTLIS